MKPLMTAALAALLAGPALAATPASPACALLTDEETAQLMKGTPMVIDGGPEASGTASCSWVEQSSGGMLGVQVMKPEAFGGTPQAYYDTMVAGVTGSGQKAEPIEGVGTKAILIADPTAANLVLMGLVGDRLLNVTTMVLGRDATIEAAKRAAGRM
ncbi:MAG: hypothetical protein IT548_04820 [Alphaproteobacteria bacterium]|nr:hypothetical protein [Alphaproteobacteria bacterium]